MTAMSLNDCPINIQELMNSGFNCSGACRNWSLSDFLAIFQCFVCFFSPKHYLAHLHLILSLENIN